MISGFLSLLTLKEVSFFVDDALPSAVLSDNATAAIAA